MTFREELKKGTAEPHHKLDSNSRIMRDDYALSDYKKLICHWAEFYLAFESTLREHAATFPDAAAFMKDREKSAMLEHDLHAFGLTASTEKVERLKRTSLFTKLFSSEPTLWAALYVLEGSTLGGQVLSRRLTTHFAEMAPLPNSGIEFYQGYREQTGIFWRAFVAKLESLGFNDEQTRTGVEAARSLFDFFSDYLEN